MTSERIMAIINEEYNASQKRRSSARSEGNKHAEEVNRIQSLALLGLKERIYHETNNDEEESELGYLNEEREIPIANTTK